MLHQTKGFEMSARTETFMDFAPTAKKGMVDVPAISLLAGHVLDLESVKALFAASNTPEFHSGQSYYLITLVRETHDASFFQTLFARRLPRVVKIVLMDGDGDSRTVLIPFEKAAKTRAEISVAPHQ